MPNGKDYLSGNLISRFHGITTGLGPISAPAMILVLWGIHYPDMDPNNKFLHHEGMERRLRIRGYCMKSWWSASGLTTGFCGKADTKLWRMLGNGAIVSISRRLAKLKVWRPAVILEGIPTFWTRKGIERGTQPAKWFLYNYKKSRASKVSSTQDYITSRGQPPLERSIGSGDCFIQ